MLLSVWGSPDYGIQLRSKSILWNFAGNEFNLPFSTLYFIDSHYHSVEGNFCLWMYTMCEDLHWCLNYSTNFAWRFNLKLKYIDTWQREYSEKKKKTLHAHTKWLNEKKGERESKIDSGDAISIALLWWCWTNPFICVKQFCMCMRTKQSVSGYIVTTQVIKSFKFRKRNFFDCKRVKHFRSQPN